MKLTVVSPTLNESENAPRLIQELAKVLEEIEYEIIIADDDSPDRTWAVAEEMAQRESRVRVLRRREMPGLGWSVIDGFSMASGDLIACIDADLQHDSAILPCMLEAIDSGADLVIGSRYARGGSVGKWSLRRRMHSWLATKLAQWLIGIRISDPMSGYFLLRRRDFLRVRDLLNGEGFKILLELVAHMENVTISEIPYTFRKRMAGKTKLSRRVVFAYISQLWRLSRRKRAKARSHSRNGVNFTQQ